MSRGPLDPARWPTPLVLALAALLVIAGVLRVRAGQPEAPMLDSINARAPANHAAHDEDRVLAIPDAVRTVTLRDVLFPEAVVADPPPPPAPLEIELIAIVRDGESLAAFVFDAAQNEYIQLGIGERLASGATLTAIENDAVVFEHMDRDVHVELTP